jgi:periplasmic protein TonB
MIWRAPALQAAMGLAALLHAALALVCWSGPSHPRAVGQSVLASPSPVHVRMASAATASRPWPPQTRVSHLQADAAIATAVPHDMATPASAPGPQVEAQAQATEAPYYPRAELDVGPLTVGPVLIAYPEDVDLEGPHIGRLSLFIDETGTVRKVEVLPTEPPLPQSMQDAARLAFLQAQFSPGQRQGAIVRSRIDIEVTFDDRPPDSLEAEARSTSAQRPTSPGA